MTHVSAIRTEPTPRAPDRPTPTPDAERRFEDALARGTDKDAERDATTGVSQEEAAGEPTTSAWVQQHAGNARDDSDPRRASRGLDEIVRPEEGPALPLPAADSRASAASTTAPAQSGATTLPASYAEMALLMALPHGIQGSETSLLITDPRSIAAHSILSRDSAGMLSLDIGAQHDGSSEQQRQELKARLEARGHRVARIGVDLLASSD